MECKTELLRSFMLNFNIECVNNLMINLFSNIQLKTYSYIRNYGKEDQYILELKLSKYKKLWTSLIFISSRKVKVSNSPRTRFRLCQSTLARRS